MTSKNYLINQTMFAHVTQKHHKNATKIWQSCAIKSAQFCHTRPNLAARTAARNCQFWLPEQTPDHPSSGSQNRPVLAARTAQFWQPELPSSGSQNSSQSCCSGQNCAVKVGSTVQAEPGSSGRKTPLPEHLKAVHIYQPSHQRKILADRG